MNTPPRPHLVVCSSIASTVILALILYGATWALPAQDAASKVAPKASDPRLVVELFAAAPDILHPVNITFDSRGRLLVIESHTHFRPKNYKGPPHDRIRVFEDTNNDGKADRISTFFEGTKATMDIEAHHDGSVYVASRSEILRVRDTDGDGKADQQQRIVFLETKGDYPHNGLSGLAFEANGDLLFGLGENLGASYKLIGSDGTTLTGEGEGGNIFTCTAEGKTLRRVATGFWNPFGVCTDIFGRMFAVDNDPDAMPPCRLMHVVEGGDYGYQFRYGRSGRHPFHSWNGQLYGTLPMAAGTGESPCEVLAYESDGLPAEYLGNLLVTAWADHRIERYKVKENGASVVAERVPFVQGGKDFRPVGLAVAPDGSLFVSDWVLSNYELHGRGAIWHIRWRDKKPADRTGDSGLRSFHRPLREATARSLWGQNEEGRKFLRQEALDGDRGPKSAALAALIAAKDSTLDLIAVAGVDSPRPATCAMAVRALAGRGEDTSRFLKATYSAAVRTEAVAGLRGEKASAQLLERLMDPDPFLRHAAIQKLARSPELLSSARKQPKLKPEQRQGLLLAERGRAGPDAAALAGEFLKDRDPDVRFLAAKWIADEKLTACRPLIVEALKDPRSSAPLYQAYLTALARIDVQDVNEGRMADVFVARLADNATPIEARTALLRLVPATHKGLTLGILEKLLSTEDESLRLEVIRMLCEHPDPRCHERLLKVVKDGSLPERARAEATVGFSPRSEADVNMLVELASGDLPSLRDEALRSLVGSRLSEAHRAALESTAKKQPDAADLVARVLGKPFTKNRPPPEQIDAWSKRLEGEFDLSAGRRIFFSSKLGNCGHCHRVEGRGQDIGPDLSTIGRSDGRSILESILQPDNKIAPHYQAWVLATAEGKTHTGMLMKTYLDEYTYLDAKGEQFKLTTGDIIDSRLSTKSIMPSGLVELLTDPELRDLVAYLAWRR